MIPTSYYFQQGALADEVRNIFARGWQFVGLDSELANNRDFLCLDLPGYAVVVQNFGGELSAFQNVCSHRFNRIQTEERGNRHLMCRYHGWTYDQSGAPIGRAGTQEFVDGPGDPARLCLKRYPLASCGRFVFVALGEDPVPLADYLGEFASVLTDLSTHIGAETHFGVVKHAANWKLLVENVLECYHCGIVHPETFVAGLGVGRKPIADIRSDARHSSCHFPRTPIRRENLRRRVMAHLDSRSLTHDSFFHVHIFPNLFISSTEGSAFYVGHALPVSERETHLRVRFFEPAVALSANERLRQDSINAQGIALGLQVIDEDRAILENVQKGIEIADGPGALGLEEVRIRTFFDDYEAAMGLQRRPIASSLAGGA